MNNNKTLYMLGEEYEAAAKKVKERIDKKRAELNALKNKTCSVEAYEIKSELKILYAEYNQAVEIAGYLKLYYSPHQGKRELFTY